MVSVFKDLWQRDMTLMYNFRFWSLTLLRIYIGAMLGYHGFLRLFAPGNFAGSVAYFVQVGIPFAKMSTFLFGFSELIGGLLLLIGLSTRFVSAALIVELIAVFFKVHMKNGLLVSNNGYEFVLLIAAALLVILVNGPGHLSLDKFFNNEGH